MFLDNCFDLKKRQHKISIKPVHPDLFIVLMQWVVEIEPFSLGKQIKILICPQPLISTINRPDLALNVKNLPILFVNNFPSPILLYFFLFFNFESKESNLFLTFNKYLTFLWFHIFIEIYRFFFSLICIFSLVFYKNT